MTRQHLISALLTALVVAGIAYAGQLTGLGGTYWSRSMAVTSTSGCVTDVTDAGSTCALFPAGTSKGQWYNVVVTQGVYGQSALVSACFTLTATGATVATGAIATDIENGAGGGACHVIQAAADRHDERPWGQDIQARPGGRAGICSGQVYSAGDYLYPPCTIDPTHADGTVTAGDTRANAAECTAYGLSGANAACEGADLWDSSQREFRGTVLLLHAATNQTLQVRKERIQER
jgi:hypothetical protein